MRLLIYIAAILLPVASASADHKNHEEEKQSARATTPAPQWYLDDIERLTRDGGRWIASNEDYQNDDEPFEAYGIEWEKGYANSITGRLFAIQDGEETGDFWRFRQYWHAGKGKAVVEQFGFGGAIGVGAVWPEDDAFRMVQTFYGPDGSAREAGHLSDYPDNDTHLTQSFDIVDGEWTPRRLYTWKRQPASDAE